MASTPISRNPSADIKLVAQAATSSTTSSTTSAPSVVTSMLFGQAQAAVVQSPSGYTAMASNGSTIFSGQCSTGSGTCGIYEAIKYVQQNYGGGKVALLGSFCPVNSPTGSYGNIEIDGYATLYVSPANANFLLSLQTTKSVRMLWYHSVGIVNAILSKRKSFSTTPYVLFPSDVPSMFLGTNGQYLGTPSSFTVSAWVNGIGSNAYGSGYFVTYGSTEKGMSWALHETNGKLYFQTPSVQIGGNGPTTSPWHAAATYSNGTVTLYLNGTQVASGSASISYVNPSYLWIGNFPTVVQQGGIQPVSGPFSWIENVQVYNTALSSSQISQLASSPMQDPVDYSSIISWSLYRYIFYVGDLITGNGFQRMYSLSLSGVF